MKKILFVAVAALAITFTSCGNKSQQTAADADTVAVEAVDLTEALQAAIENKDAASLQIAIEAAQAKLAELQAAGQLDAAKEALQSVQTWLNDNAESVKSVVGDNATINGLIEKVQSIPADAIDASTDFGVSASEAAANAANDAVNAAGEAVDAAGEAVENAAKAAKEGAENAVESAKEGAKQKAGEAIDNAANDAKKKLGL